MTSSITTNHHFYQIEKLFIIFTITSFLFTQSTQLLIPIFTHHPVPTIDSSTSTKTSNSRSAARIQKTNLKSLQVLNRAKQLHDQGQLKEEAKKNLGGTAKLYGEAAQTVREVAEDKLGVAGTMN